jgi:hypothetical protein
LGKEMLGCRLLSNRCIGTVVELDPGCFAEQVVRVGGEGAVEHRHRRRAGTIEAVGAAHGNQVRAKSMVEASS